MGRQHFSDFFSVFKFPASTASCHSIIIVLVQVGIGYVDVVVIIVDIATK